MSLPIRSSDDILIALREHPEWKEEVRREILTEELLGLPAMLRSLAESQQRTEATLRSFMESTQAFQHSMEEFKEATEKRFEAVEKRLDSLEATLQSFMEATEKRFEAVEKRLGSLEGTLQSFMVSTQAFQHSMEEFKEATEKRFETVERQQDRMLDKLRELDGNAMESRVKQKLGNYCYGRVEFVEILERKMLDRAAHIALKENVISGEERLKVGSADILAIGEDAQTSESACVVVEVSGVVEKMDVDRAAERAMLLLQTMKTAVAAAPAKFADILPKAPTKAYALVVGRAITEEASREAERKGVLFSKYHNGADVERR